jgi:uncharacterized protein YndB with AHSA1/START domain
MIGQLAPPGETACKAAAFVFLIDHSTKEAAMRWIGWSATLAVAAMAMAVPGVAAEPSWRDFPGVANSSFVEPDGDRSLQLSIDVPAGQQAVFDAFTTSEGFRSWAAPVARVDLRIGGEIEASYDAAAKLGQPDNIRNQIVAYVAPRLLVIRNIQAPPAFADPELFRKTVTTIELVRLDAAHTRVILTNSGYGAGPGFDRIYRHFEWGNAYTLAELRRRFERGPADWTRSAAQRTSADANARVGGHR